MKKLFEKPELQLTMFTAADIITTSGDEIPAPSGPKDETDERDP